MLEKYWGGPSRGVFWGLFEYLKGPWGIALGVNNVPLNEIILEYGLTSLPECCDPLPANLALWYPEAGIREVVSLLDGDHASR